MESPRSREALDIDLNRCFSATISASRRSWFPALGAFAAVVLLAGGYSTLLKPEYEADAKLLFRPDRAATLTTLSQPDEDSLKSLLSDQSPLNSEIEVLSSRPLLQRTIDKLQLRLDGRALEPADLKQKLQIKIVGAADVIQLTYQGNNPAEVAAVINTLATLYIQNSTQTDQEQTIEARNFITDQLPKTAASVQAAESALRRFRERNHIVALDREAESAVQQLEDLDNQIMTTQAQLQAATAQVQTLQRQVQHPVQHPAEQGQLSAIDASLLGQAPAVQDALLALQDAQQQLVAQRTRFSETSPVVSRLKEREAALRSRLHQTVGEVSAAATLEDKLQGGKLKQDLIADSLAAEVQRDRLARQLATLQSAKTIYQQRRDSLPRLEQEQRELERRLDAAQTTYKTLLSRAEELQVKAQQVTRHVRLIEPAVVPKAPLLSPRLRVLAVGCIGGALLAIAIVILSELRRSAQRASAPQEAPHEPREPKLPAGRA